MRSQNLKFNGCRAALPIDKKSLGSVPRSKFFKKLPGRPLWINEKFEFEKLSELVEKRLVEIINANENVTTSLVCVICDSIFKNVFRE